MRLLFDMLFFGALVAFGQTPILHRLPLDAQSFVAPGDPTVGPPITLLPSTLTDAQTQVTPQTATQAGPAVIALCSNSQWLALTGLPGNSTPSCQVFIYDSAPSVGYRVTLTYLDQPGNQQVISKVVGIGDGFGGKQTDTKITIIGLLVDAFSVVSLKTEVLNADGPVTTVLYQL